MDYSHSSKRSQVERAKAGCMQSSLQVHEAGTLLHVKILHKLQAWIEFSIHTFERNSWLCLVLKHRCDLHWNCFPVGYTLTAVLPDQLGVLNPKNTLSLSLPVSLISFLAELFLHDVNLPLLIYVWGRNFLSLVYEQWADK